MMRTLPSILLALTVLACTGGEPKSEEAPREDEPKPGSTNRTALPATVRANLGITFVTVERRAVERTRRLAGAFELEPLARREYRLPLAGTVELAVAQYAPVKEGDLLFRYRSPEWPELQHEILQGEQTIDASKAEIEVVRTKIVETETQLATLELALDGRDFAGSCDDGFSCAYTNTIAWANDATPLPMENNPRAVFERLFGDTGSTDPAVRQARLDKDASLLDSVTARAAALSRELGSGDRTKLSQYLDAVRDIERRIQMAEAQSDRELPVVAQPAGIPDTFGEHAKLMFDLMALAYQTDLTRVTTFMLGREITGRTYAEIGVPDAHHPISHHQKDPAKLAKLTKINQYHVQLFAEFIDRLRSTPDGDGSLLDHSMIIYGAGMGDSNTHASQNLPILLAGGGAGAGGRHVRYGEETPLANLHLSLLDKMGVPIDTLGHSTGRLALDPRTDG